MVVGAGPNGLVAANLLADAGWRVLVCEASDEPGGAVRSAEVTEPGWHTDLGSAFYPLGAASPVLRELELGRYGLHWRHAPSVLAHVTPANRSAVLSRNLDSTVASISEYDGMDGPAWRALFEQWREISPALLEAVLRPFPPVRAGLRLVRTMGTADLLRFGRMTAQSAHRFVMERFAGEGARLLLAGNAMHTDLGPDEAGSAVFGWLLSMAAQDVGFPVPEGGAGMITDALVRRLSERGGQIDCNRRVEKVLLRGRRAVGIRDAAGDPVLSRRAVLADVAAPILYRELVGEDALPARFVQDLNNFEWDDATIKVNWALREPIPWTARGVYGAGTVHLGTDLAGLRTFAAELAAGRIPKQPFLLLGQMTTADPCRSPAGTESAWAYTHVPRGLCWDRDTACRHVERMEAVVENNAPGFGDLIITRDVQAPLDLQDHDSNLVEGAINGGTAAMHQQFFFRPVPGLARADTPVDRLFLAGSSAHPGGAVHGAAGANAARAALAASGFTGPAYRALIRTAHNAIYR